jgi:hypothetical protein
MNRKEFFQRVAGLGVLAALQPVLVVANSGSEDVNRQTIRVSESQRDGEDPPQFKARRATTTYTGHLSFPPSTVFPLLCPVREYEWLDGWRCDMIYSDSGVAEDNCIFKTAHAGGTFWSVSRYEPPKRIEFVTFAPVAAITRLKLSLTPIAGGTDLQWTRIFTGISELGNQSVGTWKTEVDAQLTRKLEHYLKTGTMLREHSAG